MLFRSFLFHQLIDHILFTFLENLAIYEINSWQFSLLLEFSYSLANLLIHVAMVLLFIDRSPLMSKSFELVKEGGKSEQ